MSDISERRADRSRDAARPQPPSRRFVAATLAFAVALTTFLVSGPILGEASPVVVAADSSASSSHAPVADPARAEPPAETIRNLRAFARLYGYVRYFHPSDVAADVDWDAFTIHGVRQVQDASDRAELRATLDSLFAPIAPTVQLYPTDAGPPTAAEILTPADTTGLNLVAWQHQGVDLSNRGPYESVRLHRQSQSASESEFGTVARSVPATPYQGKQVRLQAAVRAEVSGSGNQAQLWLRVDRAGGRRGFFSNMGDRPVTDSAWGRYQITGPVADDASRIVFEGLMTGKGSAAFDAFQLQVRDSSGAEWTDVSLKNAGFETGKAGTSPAGWGSRSETYSVQTQQGGAYEGNQSLVIASASATGEAQPLFETHPSAGTVVNKTLGRGLSAQVPLALYSRDEQTLRPSGAPSPTHLSRTLGRVRVDSLSATDEALRLADVVIAWNVFRHFYPYFDVVDASWDRVLSKSLQRAAADTSSRQFLHTLRRMMVPLEDGHGRVSHPVDSLTNLPLRFDRVGETVVVADTASSTLAQHCARPGDVLTSIDGTAVDEALRDAKRYISGSPQWRSYRALRALGEGAPGTTARLTLRRGEETVTCRVTRADSAQAERWPRRLQTEPRPDSIDVLSNGTHYVDLTRVGMGAIQPHLDTLAQAERVVFDMRGYPEGGAQVLLQHLSSDTLRSAYFEVPKLIYPDQENVVGYTETRWTLPPRKPHVSGQIAFLTDARALSYGESIMGIVGHYDLGTIVGQPTAGVNGNVNPLTLPGEYKVYWTGMRVRKHDGSQHHLVGIRPNVEAERTIEGVRTGRDEILQTAIRVLE